MSAREGVGRDREMLKRERREREPTKPETARRGEHAFARVQATNSSGVGKRETGLMVKRG